MITVFLVCVGVIAFSWMVKDGMRALDEFVVRDFERAEARASKPRAKL